MKDPFSVEYGGQSGGKQGSLIDDLLEEKQLTVDLNNTLNTIRDLNNELRKLYDDVKEYNKRLIDIRLTIVEKLEYVANKRIQNEEEIKEDQ